MNEIQFKHLEFIQTNISRMNANSFQIKGWTITIVSALIALYVGNQNALFLYVSLFPILLFWGLDAYFLQQERKFRGLYNDVADLTDNKVKPYDMNLARYNTSKYLFRKVIISTTLIVFYLSIIILILIGIFLTNINLTNIYGS